MGFKKGYTPWNKGQTKESDPRVAKQISCDGSRLAEFWFKKGEHTWNYNKLGYTTTRKGQTHSEETKLKISMNRRGKTAWNKDRVITDPLEIERLRVAGALGLKSQQSGKETKPETMVYKALNEMGIGFEKQKLMYDKFLVDAWIPQLNCVLEVNGKYWHTLPKQIINDKRKKAYLRKCGHSVVEIWDDEFTIDNTKDVLTHLLFEVKGGENFNIPQV